MITKRKYFRIGYNNNSLVLMIGIIKIVGVNDIIEILVPITYFQNIITDSYLDN